MDVVLDGINVSFALVGYQIEPDGRAEATDNVVRDADIGYFTDGVSAAAANVSVVGMNIHDAGATKYEHGVYASEPGLVVPTRHSHESRVRRCIAILRVTTRP